jgi:hypothetical protein
MAHDLPSFKAGDFLRIVPTEEGMEEMEKTTHRVTGQVVDVGPDGRPGTWYVDMDIDGGGGTQMFVYTSENAKCFQQIAGDPNHNDVVHTADSDRVQAGDDSDQQNSER